MKLELFLFIVLAKGVMSYECDIKDLKYELTTCVNRERLGTTIFTK